MEPKSAAREVLRLSEDFFPWEIGNPAAVLQEELALAGLARARQLLRGMLELHPEAPDATGGLARSLFETWLNVTYLLLDENDALAVLVANDDQETLRLAKHIVDLEQKDPEARGKEDWPNVLQQAQGIIDGVSAADVTVDEDDAPKKGSTLNTYDMALRVARRLREHGHSDSAFPLRVYTVVYSVESNVTIHSGITAMKQYFDPEPASAHRVVAGPWMGDDRYGGLLDNCTAMVNSLTHQVAVRLDLDTSELEAFTTDWHAELNTRE